MVITDLNELNDDSSGLMYVYADWCKHCTEVKNEMDALIEKFPEVNFFYLDFDNPDVKKFMDDSEFVGVPFFMVINKGEVVATSEGVDGEKEEFFSELEEIISDEFLN